MIKKIKSIFISSKNQKLSILVMKKKSHKQYHIYIDSIKNFYLIQNYFINLLKFIFI